MGHRFDGTEKRDRFVEGAEAAHAIHRQRRPAVVTTHRAVVGPVGSCGSRVLRLIARIQVFVSNSFSTNAFISVFICGVRSPSSTGWS